MFSVKFKIIGILVIILAVIVFTRGPEAVTKIIDDTRDKLSEWLSVKDKLGGLKNLTGDLTNTTLVNTTTTTQPATTTIQDDGWFDNPPCHTINDIFEGREDELDENICMQGACDSGEECLLYPGFLNMPNYCACG